MDGWMDGRRVDARTKRTHRFPNVGGTRARTSGRVVVVVVVVVVGVSRSLTRGDGRLLI
jgi:hypothetical protein